MPLYSYNHCPVDSVMVIMWVSYSLCRSLGQFKQLLYFTCTLYILSTLKYSITDDHTLWLMAVCELLCSGITNVQYKDFYFLICQMNDFHFKKSHYAHSYVYITTSMVQNAVRDLLNQMNSDWELHNCETAIVLI